MAGGLDCNRTSALIVGTVNARRKDKRRCSERSLRMLQTVGNGDSQQRQKLIVRNDLAMEKAPPGACSPDADLDKEECKCEILLCHFQYNKNKVEKSLTDAVFGIRVSFLWKVSPRSQQMAHCNVWLYCTNFAADQLSRITNFSTGTCLCFTTLFSHLDITFCF